MIPLGIGVGLGGTPMVSWIFNFVLMIIISVLVFLVIIKLKDALEKRNAEVKQAIEESILVYPEDSAGTIANKIEIKSELLQKLGLEDLKEVVGE